MAAYALSMLGLRSANGTSTVIFTRVGLNCSTVLGTLVTSCCQGGGSRREAANWAQMSRGNLTGAPSRGPPTGVGPVGSRLVTAGSDPYTRPADVRARAARGVA